MTSRFRRNPVESPPSPSPTTGFKEPAPSPGRLHHFRVEHISIQLSRLCLQLRFVIQAVSRSFVGYELPFAVETLLLAPDTERVDKGGKRRRGMASAWIVQVVALERRAPFGQDFLKKATLNVWKDEFTR